MQRIITFLSSAAIFLIFTLDVFAQAPGVNWARSIGGNDYDYGASMTIDASGNIYYTGVFTGTVDFNPGAGVFNLTSVTTWDMYVSKLDNSGNFVWAFAFNGTDAFDWDWAGCITVDAAGFIYVTGAIGGTTDFNPGPAVFNLTASGSGDIFVLKLNNSGNFVWAKIMLGAWSSLSNHVIVDPVTGAVYTGGGFEISVDFDPGAGTNWLTVAGGEDAFVSKLDASGNFVWAKKFGGTWHEEVSSIALDVSGNVYTTGYFQNTVDFDPGTGVYNLTSTSSYDVFITKLTSSGNFVWAKKISGTGSSSGSGSSEIITDPSGNIFVCGGFSGTYDFDPGAGVFNVTANSSDSFILKLDGAGNFIWVKSFGVTGNAGCSAIQLDGTGNIYTSGSFSGIVDFDPGAGVYNVASVAATTDFFVAKLNSSGNFMWVQTGGGTDLDGSSYLRLDGLGHVNVLGIYFSPTFTVGTSTLINQGLDTPEIFLLQLDSSAPGPLPVELAYFSAKAITDDQVEVKWTTLSEVNNDYFIVQKSTDGIHFEDCVRIIGAGNSSTNINYYFLDENPFQITVSYYRLKQVDYDGTAKYSEMIAVKMGKKDFDLLHVIGDGTNQFIKIIFTTGFAGNHDYRLHDSAGNIVIQQFVSFDKGINHLSINTGNLSSGIYYFSLSNGNEVLKRKLFY